MTTLEYFRVATAKFVCHYHDCITCHEILHYDKCPDACDKINKRYTLKFIERVAELLKHKEEVNDIFDFELTDEELCDILESAAEQVNGMNLSVEPPLTIEQQPTEEDIPF